MSIVINTRILSASLTGVQRYLAEIKSRIRTEFVTVEPDQPLRGMRGHLWEQSVLLAKRRSELLWSPSNSGPIFRKNQIVTIHDMVPIDHPEWVGKKYAAWYGAMWPALAKNVKHVFTVSNFSRDRIMATCGIGAEKISVFYNGVDERFFNESSLVLPETLGIPFRRYVLAVGSIEPRKNLENLFLAWKKVEHRYGGEVGLVVAGGRGASQVFGKFDVDCKPDFVHFAGHVDDAVLPALYRNADLFCYTSRYEGFGLPLAEAMAAGVPCIGSSATSIPEVVGNAGLLVEPTDVDQIAEAMILLLENSSKADEYRRAGPIQARKFSWDVSAAGVDEIFNKWQ